MYLCYSEKKTPDMLSAQHRYTDLQLLDNVQEKHNAGISVWLSLIHGHLRLQECEFQVVCRILAAEHDLVVDSSVPYEDDWKSETYHMEEAARKHMDDPDSSDNDSDGSTPGI
jgi:hypothetical protein